MLVGRKWWSEWKRCRSVQPDRKLENSCHPIPSHSPTDCLETQRHNFHLFSLIVEHTRIHAITAHPRMNHGGPGCAGRVGKDKTTGLQFPGRPSSASQPPSGCFNFSTGQRINSSTIIRVLPVIPEFLDLASGSQDGTFTIDLSVAIQPTGNPVHSRQVRTQMNQGNSQTFGALGVEL
jgi:hypothetical protein